MKCKILVNGTTVWDSANLNPNPDFCPLSIQCQISHVTVKGREACLSFQEFPRCVVYVCFWLRRGLPQTATLNTAVRLSTTLQYFNILLRESPKKTIKCKRLRTDKWASFQKWSSVDPILIWLFKVFFEWLPASTVTRPVPRQDLAMRPARCLWLRGNSPAPPPPKPLCVLAFNSVVLCTKQSVNL